MLELALKGSKRYWTWMMALLGVIGVGFLIYLGSCNSAWASPA